MTFFDKLFTIKNRSKNDTVGGVSNNHLSCCGESSSSHHCRVAVFRECDRRGRKLLFDSSSVERVPLDQLPASAQLSCTLRRCSDHTERRNSDFVEVSSAHAYKYKKPCNDVLALGEMIFGSVAMVHRGGTTSKIHCLPPKEQGPSRLMFSSIVYAPSKPLYHNHSERSGDSSYGSVSSLTEATAQTSSSDSKLYSRIASQPLESSYPALHRTAPVTCSSGEKGLARSKNALRLEDLCCEGTAGFQSETDLSRAGLGVPSADSDQRSLNRGSLDSSNGSFYTPSDASSRSSYNASGSLTSLRKRWIQNCSTLGQSCDDCDSTKSRSKLGIALVLDLTGLLYKETEKFIFEHSIVIDNILNRLQSTVENAYVKKEHFVDMIYCGYQEVRNSLCQLLNSKKRVVPIWLTLADEAHRESQSKHESSLMENIYLHLHENIGGRKRGESLSSPSNSKHKFLTDFCEVLEKFDTKNTNFFVSTLLTAVLTHHLSWVNIVMDKERREVTKQDSCGRGRKCNPLWAQFNDITGALGCPLKSTKTIITGSENHRVSLSHIVQTLTYFIRSYVVYEKTYDVNFEEVACPGGCDEVDNFDSGVECVFPMEHLERRFVETVVRDSPVTRETLVRSDCGLKRTARQTTGLSETKQSLYPSIADLAKMENVHVEDLDYDRTVFIDEFLRPEKISEKVNKLIRVPGTVRNSSPDEGYDSCKSEVAPRRVESERQMSSRVERKADVVFVIGCDEKPTRTVTTRPEVISLEEETGGGAKGPRENLLPADMVLPMPSGGKCHSRRLQPPAVFGSVNDSYNPDQVIQGVVQGRRQWERSVRRDLALSAHHAGLQSDVTEAVCIIGDISSWDVSLISSHTYVIDRSKVPGLRVGMSRLVADTLESLSRLFKLKVNPEFCLHHVEKKLEEIYHKSKALAELLASPELCTLESLTQRLDIEVNDVVLLLSVATTHSPHVARRYGLSFL